MKTRNIKNILRTLGNLISFLSLVFIVYTVIKLDIDFSFISNWYSFITVIVISVLLKVLTVFISGWTWTGWLRFFSGEKVSLPDAEKVYVKANIGKYLPGNVMHYVERNLFAINLGISHKKIAASTILEVFSLVAASGILSVCFSFSMLKDALKNILLLYHPTTAVVIFLFAALCAVVIAFLLFCRKKKTILYGNIKKALLSTMLLSVVQYAFVLLSLGFVMVLLYGYRNGGVSLNEGSIIIAGYIIAWVLGFVIPGAPGGIGVRELVLTLLLGNVMGTECVVTLSIIHRLITIIGDFGAYLVGLSIKRGVT